MFQSSWTRPLPGERGNKINHPTEMILLFPRGVNATVWLGRSQLFIAIKMCLALLSILSVFQFWPFLSPVAVPIHNYIETERSSCLDDM